MAIALSVTTNESKKTVSYPVALSSVESFVSGCWTQAGNQPGDTRGNNLTTTSVNIGYPDAGANADSHTDEDMGAIVYGSA